MSGQLITCPNCGNEFEASAVLTASIRSQVRSEVEADLVRKQEEVTRRMDAALLKERELQEKAEAIEDAVATRMEEERKRVAAKERERAKQELKAELDDLHVQIAERNEKLEAAQRKELEFRQKERELDEERKALELTLQERLDAERTHIAEKAKQQAEEAFNRKTRESDEALAGLQEQLAEREKKLDEAHQKELKFLRMERELQEKERTLDLELERRLTEAQGELHEKAKRQAEEAQALKMREKDDLISQLKAQTDELRRRIEVGSQEAAGEALEHELEEKLRAAFPFDIFQEVKKGAHGADIIQTVLDDRRRVCGKILWEAKNARNFQMAWIEKLKKDQIDAGANLAVLTTVAMPPQIGQFGQWEDGPLWIAGYGCAIALCAALRQQLMCVAREKLMVEHRDTVRDILFDYVTGPEFSHRVRAIVDTYTTMQDDLESEKRSIKRIWKKREKQIEKVLGNLVEMRGELDGLVGANALPEAETLTLDHIAGDEYDDDPDEAIDGVAYDDEDELDDEEADDETLESTGDGVEDADSAPNLGTEKWWLNNRNTRGRGNRL